MKNRIALIGALAILLFAGLANAQVPGKIPNKYGQTYADNAYLRFGNSEDSICGYNTTQTTDALVCGLSVDSNNFIVSEKGDVGFDFAHALSTDPTLFIHSHNQSTSQWISLSHNGTNGVINVGTGSVTFPGGVTITGSVGGAAGTFTSLDVTDGNITNVGSARVDSIDADATTVDYNDVNILELSQADLTSTCTLGQLKLDTGGSTKELCYCQATNTWVCTAMTAGPTD